MQFPLRSDNGFGFYCIGDVEMQKVVFLLVGIPRSLDQLYFVSQEVEVHREARMKLNSQLEVLSSQYFLHSHLIVVELSFHLLYISLEFLYYLVLPCELRL